jgi:hypothetical protein
MGNKYEHRAVLFLDILGFKRFIVQEREDLVEESLSVTSARYQSNYEISSFSDNMVVSMRFERGYELLELIHFASYLAWHLLHKGVLSRGGIAVGKLHHQNGIVYGPALLMAYQLESQVAIYPRIVLEKDAIAKSLQIGGNPSGCEDAIRAQLRTDLDGFEHIHLMGHAAMMPFHDMLSPEELTRNGRIRHQALLEAKVAAARMALDNNPPTDVRSRAKHEWMRRYVDYYENIYNHGPRWRPLSIAQAMLQSVPDTVELPNMSALEPLSEDGHK